MSSLSANISTSNKGDHTNLPRTSGTFSPVHVVVLGSILTTLHLGSGEFVSIQFLTAFAIYIYFFRFWFANSLHLLTFAAVAAILSVGSFLSGQEAHFYLVALRVATAVSLLAVLARSNSTETRGFMSDANLRGALTLCLCANLLLAILQLVDVLFLHTASFYLPAAWFSLNYGTLQDEISIAVWEAGYLARPSGFYSEPSALAAVGLVGVFIGNFCRDRLLLSVSLISVFVSFSLSGIIFAAFLVFAFIMFKQGIMAEQWPRRVFGAVLFFALMTAAPLIFERLSAIRIGADLSTIVRFNEPLRLLALLISEGQLLGASRETLLALSDESVSTIFDNWFFNQLLLYGLFGFFAVALVFLIFPPVFWPLLIAFGIMNGDIFYYDRMILLVIAMITMNQYMIECVAKRRRAEQC